MKTLADVTHQAFRLVAAGEASGTSVADAIRMIDATLQAAADGHPQADDMVMAAMGAAGGAVIPYAQQLKDAPQDLMDMLKRTQAEMEAAQLRMLVCLRAILVHCQQI